VNNAENQQKSAENLLKRAIILRIRTEKLRRETKELAEYLRAKSEKLGNSKGGK
jgi:hypothetical protein